MNVRRIIREELEKEFHIFVETENIMKSHTTNSSNYEFEPLEIWVKLEELESIGKKLDSNYSKNISELKVLSTGERFGRLIAEVGYPDGTVVLFYKSSKGTSGKEMGGWFPIPGFLKSPANGLGLKQGWFIKTSGVENRYGIKTFQGTADYLKANEDNLGEIYLSAGGQGLKPGPGRKFPEENKEPGDSLNLSVSDGPHQFPK